VEVFKYDLDESHKPGPEFNKPSLVKILLGQNCVEGPNNRKDQQASSFRG
jgi:hypothetical protein